KSSDKPNPRGYPGKFCANDSDTLELP
nr:Chain C, Proteinase-activated receptor 4 [synthetic construct]